jgi:hypothetical protein
MIFKSKKEALAYLRKWADQVETDDIRLFDPELEKEFLKNRSKLKGGEDGKIDKN